MRLKTQTRQPLHKTHLRLNGLARVVALLDLERGLPKVLVQLSLLLPAQQAAAPCLVDGVLPRRLVKRDLARVDLFQNLRWGKVQDK